MPHPMKKGPGKAIIALVGMPKKHEDESKEGAKNDDDDLEKIADIWESAHTSKSRLDKARAIRTLVKMIAG